MGQGDVTELGVGRAPTPLPAVIRHVLVAMVEALTYRVAGPGGFYDMQGRINAPGFLDDLTRTLWAGDIAAARRVLRQFGVGANAPFANMQTVRALEVALEAAFRVVEIHGNAAFSQPETDLLDLAISPAHEASP